MSVKIKRIYDQAEAHDGIRILVDRVWPRGMSKEKAQLDDWLKEIGPSTELRKWFGHDPEKFDAFKERYQEELQEGQQQKELQTLKDLVRQHDSVTLLFSAKDETHNQARVLKDILDRQS